MTNFVSYPFSPTLQRQAGFSLIEAALVIMILGLLIAPILEVYRMYIRNKQTDTTMMAIERTDLTLKQYYEANGVYPCPAIAPGGIASCGTAVNNVLVGTVPYATLNMKEKDQTDGYNFSLTYIVSEPMTQAANAYTSNPTVQVGIVDLNTGTQLGGTTITPAVLALISHGKTGKGGVRPTDGTIPFACDPADVDQENCNGNEVVFVTDRSITDTIDITGSTFPSIIKIPLTGMPAMLANSQRNNIIKIIPPKGTLGTASPPATGNPPGTLIKAEIRKIANNTGDTFTLDTPLDNIPEPNSTILVIPNSGSSRYAKGKLQTIRNTRHQNIPGNIYDDYVFYRKNVTDAPWMSAAGAGGDVIGMVDGEVWIGYNESMTPSSSFSDAAVEINGSIRVNDEFKSPQVCTQPPNSICFDPTKIGSTTGGMQCPKAVDPPENTMMIGISNGDAVCGKPDINGPTVVCPPGLSLHGNSCLRPETVPPGSCGGITVVTNCATSTKQSLLMDVTSSAPQTAGPLTYTCQADGSWFVTGTMPVCAPCNYQYTGYAPANVSMACPF
jgi:type II secretory pathway pseudopilin PulG